MELHFESLEKVLLDERGPLQLLAFAYSSTVMVPELLLQEALSMLESGLPLLMARTHRPSARLCFSVAPALQPLPWKSTLMQPFWPCLQDVYELYEPVPEPEPEPEPLPEPEFCDAQPCALV